MKIHFEGRRATQRVAPTRAQRAVPLRKRAGLTRLPPFDSAYGFAPRRVPPPMAGQKAGFRVGPFAHRRRRGAGKLRAGPRAMKIHFEGRSATQRVAPTRAQRTVPLRKWAGLTRLLFGACTERSECAGNDGRTGVAAQPHAAPSKQPGDSALPFSACRYYLRGFRNSRLNGLPERESCGSDAYGANFRWDCSA